MPDDAAEIQVLSEALLNEHRPQTVTERFLVDRMVSALWFANRALKLMSETDYASAKERARSVKILNGYRISSEQSFDRAVQTLHLLRADQDDFAVRPRKSA